MHTHSDLPDLLAAAGMQAILFTGAVDRGSTKTSADRVYASMEILPDLVRHLAKT